MNYTKVKFEIYLSDTYLNKFIDELDNIGLLCLSYEKNNYFITSVNNVSNNKIKSSEEKTDLLDNVKLEFHCDKDVALEVINLIKKIHLTKNPVYSILPIIN